MEVREKDFTKLPLNTRHVMMSGQIRKCPCCGTPAMVKRSVETIWFIHKGVVQGAGVNLKPISASVMCKLAVGGKS